MGTKQLLLIFILPVSAWGQILNIDAEAQDSVLKKRYLLFSGSYARDKQKRNLSDIEGSIEAGWRRKNNYAFIFATQGNLVLSGGDFIQNEGYLHLRYRDLDKRKTSMEFFTQYQWNGLWGLMDRRIAGANVRHRFYDGKNSDFYTGLGAFYQMERWNYAGVEDQSLIPAQANPVQQNLPRMNAYFKAARILFGKVDLIAESFFQTNAPLSGKGVNLRWFMMGRINYPINNHMNIAWNYDHMYNHSPLVPIRRLYSGHALRISVVL